MVLGSGAIMGKECGGCVPELRCGSGVRDSFGEKNMVDVLMDSVTAKGEGVYIYKAAVVLNSGTIPSKGIYGGCLHSWTPLLLTDVVWVRDS